MSVAAGSDGLNDVYEALDRYNWDDDVEFQSGLSAILGSNSTPAQAAELTLRARCFYYSRKFTKNIDFDAYKSYRESRNRPPPPLPSNTPLFPTATTDSVLSSVTTPPETAGGILPNPSPNEPPAPYPTSFAHIVELVTTGQPIPGIKEIPDTLLTGQGSVASKQVRRKPWERSGSGGAGETGAETASGGGGNGTQV